MPHLAWHGGEWNTNVWFIGLEKQSFPVKAAGIPREDGEKNIP